MKHMIWTSDDLLNEAAKEDYQNSQREMLDDDTYEVSDEEWAEEVFTVLVPPYSIPEARLFSLQSSIVGC